MWDSVSIPQAAHTSRVCTGCFGPEDFPASDTCLPGYPILGYQHAHPAPVPGASEPGLLMCPGPRGVSVLNAIAVSPWALSGHRAVHLGLPSCWLVGSGRELSSQSDPLPAPAHFLVSSKQCHCSPSFPGTVVSARLGHTKPRGPLILLDECFTMDYRRG